MKGLVFVEFLDLVEDKFGLEVVDEIIDASDLPSNAEYTAVGTYDFQEMVSLLSALSQRVNISIQDLLQVYGEHLLSVFHARFPEHFEGIHSTFELLARLDDTIHVEVLKLYPEAELPRFKAQMIESDNMLLTYQSGKPLTMFAYGLIVGAAVHFKEEIEIELDDRSSDEQTIVDFTLLKR